MTMTDTTSPDRGTDTVERMEQVAPETQSSALKEMGDGSIRPFQFHASDEQLADLKHRIETTGGQNVS